MTGFVLGIINTSVNPPAVAAAAPVSSDSLCSYPGSAKFANVSTHPGEMHRPGLDTILSAVSSFTDPILEIIPFSMRMSTFLPLKAEWGSTTRACLMRSFIKVQSYSLPSVPKNLEKCAKFALPWTFPLERDVAQPGSALAWGARGR